MEKDQTRKPRKRGQHAEQDGEQNPGGQNKRGQQKQASNAGNTQREPQARKGQHNRHRTAGRPNRRTDDTPDREKPQKDVPNPRGTRKTETKKENPTPGWE